MIAVFCTENINCDNPKPYMYIIILHKQVCRSVKTITVDTNLFAKYRKLHKFAATNSNFNKIYGTH